MQLFAYSEGISKNIIQVASKAAGVNLEVKEVRYEDQPKEIPQSALSLVTSYQFKFPALVTEHGPLFGTFAIARYVASFGAPNFYSGLSNVNKAAADKWLDFTQTEVLTPVNALLWQSLGFIPKDAEVTNLAKSDLQKVLVLLNNYLLDKTYLISRHLTLADVALSLALFDLFTKLVPASFQKPFPNVLRWFNTCLHQPAVVAIIPSYKLATTDTEAEDESWKYGGTLPSRTTGTEIVFKSTADLHKFLSTDKYWLFGLLWNARVQDNKLLINYFSEEKNFSKVYASQLSALFGAFSYVINNVPLH